MCIPLCKIYKLCNDVFSTKAEQAVHRKIVSVKVQTCLMKADDNDLDFLLKFVSFLLNCLKFISALSNNNSYVSC